jgi:hypothetical protein
LHTQRISLDGKHRGEESEKAKQELAKVKAPRSHNEEFESFWSDAIDETIAQIDEADDVSTCDSVYNSADARAAVHRTFGMGC